MYRFVLDELGRLAPRGARILDFGCGGGELVAAGRDAGFDFTGADVFFGGTTARDKVSATGALGAEVFDMPGGRLPFDDASFDIVCANQVFEHVDNLDLALREVRRVLRPGGLFLNIFPSVGVIREGHCGVAMAHWLQPWPAIQRRYLHLARLLGFGYYRDSRSCAEWAAHMGNYLQRYTAYRPQRLLLKEHRRHFAAIASHEECFAAFRLSGRPSLAAAVRHPLLRPFTRAAIRALGGMVLVARTA